MLDLLTSHTVQNVAAGAAILGLTSGMLGCFAVLRGQSLLGDALSHAALPGIALGFIISGSRYLPGLLAGALVSGFLAALLMVVLERYSRLKTDAVTGIVLSSFFAFGMVLMTGIQNSGNAAQAGLDGFLFGQAAAIVRGDLAVLAGTAAVTLGLVLVFFKEFKLLTFDPVFAASIGLRVRLLESVLMLLIALAVVIGLQLVGVVLMSALLVAPAVAARQWVTRLEAMLLLAGGVGLVSGVGGALISSAQRGLSTGPVVVIIATGLAVLSILVAPGRGVIWESIQRTRNGRRLRSSHLLTTLLRLGQEHGDRQWPAETGMLDAYTGLATGRILKQLEQNGLVRSTRHMPGEGLHWQLTDAGVSAAERILRDLGRTGR